MKPATLVLSALVLVLSSSLLLLAGGSNPVPLINDPLVPAAVAPGGAGFTLTVQGAGFVSGSIVNWNGNARATRFVSTAQLTASIPASDIANPGTAAVTVVNPTPGGGVSNVVFLPVTTAAGTVVLSGSNVFRGISPPARQAAGDFNQDGKLDLAVQDPGGVQILLGNGDGSFQAAVLDSVSGGTVFLIVGDFNGDGQPDIAAIGSGIVTILLGNGDGSFQAPISSPIDTSIPNPSWLAAGDLNNDGKLDLVVGYQGGSEVSVLLGNGDGTFQPFVDYATAPEPTAVVVGDFNGDGNLDLATANFGSFAGNTVSILLGNGDGTFQPHVEYLADGAPLALVAADFNGDGKLDLAVDCSCGHSSPCGRPGTVAILLGNGDGTFKPAVLYDADEFPYTVASGDFNGDGKLDLALTDLDSGKISFLLGNADGTFQPHFEQPVGTLAGAGAGPVGLVIGDFNSDGLLDLVTNSTQIIRFCWLFNCHYGTVHSVTLLSQIQAPVADFSVASLSFGNQDLGTTTAPLTVTLSNPGRAPLAIAAVSTLSTGGSFAVSNACGSSLQPGTNCPLNVTFSASALGSATGQLIVADNAAGSPQTVALAGNAQDFSISATALTPATVSAGNSATSTITVTSLASFSSPVVLTCSVQPIPVSAPTCSITGSVTPTANGNASVRLTIHTIAPTTSLLASPALRRGLPPLYALWLPLCGLALLGTGVSSERGWRKQLLPILLLCALGAGLILQAGCGGGGTSSSTTTTSTPGTPAGAYTITLSSASGALQHSAKVTFTVQ